MSKILYFTDPHIRGKSPIHRLDNYNESIMGKMEEVVNLANTEKCNMIINGGDLFDSPVVSLRMVDDLIPIVKNSNCPFYTIIGNHDMINANWNIEDATSISHLIRLGNIRLFETYEDLHTKIDGFNYSYEIETQMENGLLKQLLKTNKYNIAVIHAMITEGSNPFKCIGYKDIQTNYDLILCSHSHVPFGIKTYGKTTYVSPGALGRLTADPKDCQRNPQCAIIDTDTREVRLVELQTAKPYTEVFDIEMIKKQKESNKVLDLFVANLKDTKIQSLNLKGIIKDICSKETNMVEIEKDILKRISENEKV